MTIDLQNKCLACIHAKVCVNNLGGADLDVVGDDCPHYAPNIEPFRLPTVFYQICDVPGFQGIVEFQVERVDYVYGDLNEMWGFTRTSQTVVSAKDIGKTVFWTREEAEARINALIEERRNEQY